MEKGNNKKDKVSPTEYVSLCNNIVIGVDGSEGSKNAVEIVVKDFHRKGLDKIYIVHISDAKKEHEKGVQYHSKTIYNHYHEFLKELISENDYEVIFEERKENENVFEQINEIANNKKANLLVLGFRGVSGTKNRPDELSKGVKYLVHKPLIPCLVVKEKTHREFRQELGFKWLVCIESAESKSFKAFQHILRYVDAENDTIHGFTVDLKDGNSKKVQEAFLEICKKNNITKTEFSSVEKEEKDSIKTVIHNWIVDHLKDDAHFIDFLVLGYNPTKYNFNKEAPNTTVEVIKDINVNVFFDH